MKIILGRILLLASSMATAAVAQQSQPSVTVVPPAMKPDAVATKLETVAIYPFAVHNLRFSHDGKWLATGHGAGDVRVWEVETGKLRWATKAHTNWAFSVAWMSDNQRLVSGGGDDLVTILDTEGSGPPAKVFRGHDNDVHAVAVTKDGKAIYSAGDDWSVIAWNAAGDPMPKVWSGHTKQIPTLALSPDERLVATGSRDESIRLWQAADGKQVDILIGHSADVMSVDFSPDGSRLASASYDGTVRLWDVKSGKALRIFKGHSARVYSVAFSPDGRRIASAGDDTLRIWDAESGNSLAVHKVHGSVRDGEVVIPERLSSVDYHPRGQIIAVGSTTGRAYLLSADTGKVIHELFVPPTQER